MQHLDTASASSGTSAASSAAALRAADPARIRRLVRARTNVCAAAAKHTRRAAVVAGLEASVAGLAAQLGDVPPHLALVRPQPDEGPAFVVPLPADGRPRARPWRERPPLPPRARRPPPAARPVWKVSRALHRDAAPRGRTADERRARAAARRARRHAWEQTKLEAFPDTLLPREYAAVAPPLHAPVPSPPRREVALLPDGDRTRLAELRARRQALEDDAARGVTAYQILVSVGTLRDVLVGTDVLGDLRVVVSYGADLRGFLTEYTVESPETVDFSGAGSVEFLVDAAALPADLHVAVYELQHPDDDALYPVCGPTSFALPPRSSIVRAAAEHTVPLAWWHADVPFDDELDRLPASLDVAVSVTPLPFNSRAAAQATRLDARLSLAIQAVAEFAASHDAQELAASSCRDEPAEGGSSCDTMSTASTAIGVPCLDVIPPSPPGSPPVSPRSEASAESAATTATTQTAETATTDPLFTASTASLGGPATPPPRAPTPPPPSILSGLRGLDHPLDIAFDLDWASHSSEALTALDASNTAVVAAAADGAAFLWRLSWETVASTSSSEPKQKKHTFTLAASFPATHVAATACVLVPVANGVIDEQLVVAYANAQMRVWQAGAQPGTAACLQLVSLGSPVTALAADAFSMVSGSADGSIHLWSTGRLRLVVTLHTSGAAVTDATVLGARAITASADGSLSIWSIARSGACLLQRLAAHKRSLCSFAVPLSVTSGLALDLLATASADGMIKVWDVPDGSVSHNYFALKRGPVVRVVFDGSHLLSIDEPDPLDPDASRAPQLKLWSLSLVRPVAKWDLPAAVPCFCVAERVMAFGFAPHATDPPPGAADDALSVAVPHSSLRVLIMSGS